MAESTNLVDLETHRRRLEDNVEKLRKSLQHWQTWEAEYEGLKEEILGLGSEVGKQQLDVVAKGFDGGLLNDKEIKDLFGGGDEATRNSQQVLGLLSRRIDYVQENVKAIERQLNLADEMLIAATVLFEPEVRIEKGLPLIEILEELDDDGNVLSGSITTPDNSTLEAVEALRKADIKTASQRKEENSIAETPFLAAKPKDQSIFTKQDKLSPANNDANPREESQRKLANAPKDGEVTKAIDEVKSKRKKSGTFSNDMKDSKSGSRPYALAVDEVAEHQTKDESAETLEQNTSIAKSVELEDTDDEDSDEVSESPVIPATDSPEDALLRKQMLQYSLDEVGAIVAEMDLDDTDSELSYTDEDGDDHYDSSADDENEKSSRTTKSIINEKYQKEMLELEQKLNAKMLQNVGPEPYKWVQNDRTRTRLSAADLAAQSTSERPRTVKQKGVRFAEELDISNAQQDNNAKHKLIVRNDLDDRPIVDTLDERPVCHVTTNLIPNAKQKISRFKTARAQGQQVSTATETDRNAPVVHGSSLPTENTPTNYAASLLSPFFSSTISSHDHRSRRVPEGPVGRIQSDTLVEHPPQGETSQPGPEPDELDPDLLHQVALHYHRTQNRMLQQKGEFALENGEDEEEGMMMEYEGGKKMSRFKAARLARLGK